MQNLAAIDPEAHAERANIVGKVTLDMGNPKMAISTSGLALPLLTCPFSTSATAFCTGNAGRNAFTGPNLVNLDSAIQKGFPIHKESNMLTIRAEFYNLFNRANYYNPISQLSTDGTSINPNFGKIMSAHNPRQVQFAARFTW